MSLVHLHKGAASSVVGGDFDYGSFPRGGEISNIRCQIPTYACTVVGGNLQ